MFFDTGHTCPCNLVFEQLHKFIIFSHCIRGSGGFQQQIPHMPVYPGFSNQGIGMLRRGGYGIPQQPQMQMRGFPRRDTVCYSCMPGGNVRHRQRRSAGEPEGRFIEIHDRNGKASLNTTYPIEIFVIRKNTTRRTPLLELRASMKQLRDHSRYQIVSGNKHRYFRIHHRGHTSVLHFTKNAVDHDDRLDIEPTEYDIHLRATTTLDNDAIKKTSFHSDTIQEALEEAVELNVKIFLEE